MELSIRVEKGALDGVNLAAAIEGNKIDIKDAAVLSMHFTDGAIDEAFEKAEAWDNLPEDIRNTYMNDNDQRCG